MGTALAVEAFEIQLVVTDDELRGQQVVADQLERGLAILRMRRQRHRVVDHAIERVGARRSRESQLRNLLPRVMGAAAAVAFVSLGTSLVSALELRIGQSLGAPGEDAARGA